VTWTLVPTQRLDLVIELDELLDGSGNYTGPWLETTDIYTVHVACKFNGGSPTVTIEHGIYTSHSADPKTLHYTDVPVSSTAASADVDLMSRYFRLTIAGGSADNLFQSTIRRLS